MYILEESDGLWQRHFTISFFEGASNGVGYDGESIDVAAKPTTQNVEHEQGSLAATLATDCGNAQACGSPLL
jgi:hypothetical protein